MIFLYELIQLSERDFYIDCPSKIGVCITGENEAVLIDSGSDKDAGKKALRILQEKNLSLKAIYNTHSHADHTGGNRFLQEKTGCAVFAPGIECDFVNHTVLEPAYLYGGNPPDSLRHKFLMAQPSDARPLSENDLPQGFKSVDLPGHSFEMTGFITADGNFFVGDAVAASETLEKYGFSFLVDPEKFMQSAESLKEIEAKAFVPSHAAVTADISALADCNIESVRKTAEKICDFCDCASFDTIIKRVFDEYGLTMTAQQHALNGSTVRSYLAYLERLGRIACEINENTMIWRKNQ